MSKEIRASPDKEKNIPEWLVHKANDGTFPLNVDDLIDEFNEILPDQDSIVDDDSRNRCCELLRSRQSDIDYLSSLRLHKVIAKHVRASCRRSQAAEETIESWVNLDAESAKLVELADEIASAIRAAWNVRSPPGKGESKFTDVLRLGSIDNFHHGLENLIGYPPTHSDFLSLMKREHDQEPFAGRYRAVDPKSEWNIVMQSDTWNFRGVTCQPTIEITGRECTEPLEFYAKAAQKKFEHANAIHDVLNEAEVAALRLWTGPMHEKYAEVLRNPHKVSGPYVTTLHAINSGITKLARIWPLPVSRKVYRGYKNLRLQDLKKDSFNCVGGVEKCVLATSEDFNIAVNYSEDGAFILEIEVGQANRGADVSWLSQFPHEREILFNALSNVEFVRSPQQRMVDFKDKSTGDHTPGKLLVYQVHLSANLRSKTLEEFFILRKDLHLSLVDVLAQEALRTISMRKADSRRGLIERLCDECIHQCNVIRVEAEQADVCVYNEGTQAYIELVKDAIMFKSRSESIIDLALGWFDCGMADPAVVEGLLGWQLKALRDAFKDCERPKVTRVVLEQDRCVDSLFGAKTLNLGAVHKVDTVCNVAKLLSLNPELESLDMQVASATPEVWENVLNALCPDRQRLRINGFHLAQYAISTLLRLELRPLGIQMATMIAPALLMHPPSALTCLNLCGTPIACAGAESLGRAFTGLQSLKYLDLRSCKIADRGCTGIAQALPALSELETLSLAHNQVEDDGFNVLTSMIRSHGLSRLQSVDMRFNTTQLPSSRCGARCVIKNHIFSKLSTTAKVPCVAWSPGGERIASALWDGTIIVWDAQSGDHVSTLKGHTAAVTSVAWDPRGDKIVSGGCGREILIDPGEIIIWDAKTGNKVSTLKGHTTVKSVAWRPGGDQIVSGGHGAGGWGSPGEVIIWDAKTGEQVSTLKGHTAAVTSVAWRPASPGHPGGDQIVSGGKGGYFDSRPGEIIIWDAQTGEQLSKLKGHTAMVTSVAWRPGGDQIASASCDETIIIWDAKTRKKVSKLKGHTAQVLSVAWRPGGDQIASGSVDNTIIIWDAKTGKQVSTLEGHANWVNSVAWRPGIASASSGDLIASTIIIWDAKIGQQVSACNRHSSRSVVGSVASSLRPSVSSWRWRPSGAKTSEQISTLNGHTSYVTSVAWRPGGDRITSASYKEIIIWDATRGHWHQVSTLTGSDTNWVESVAWRPLGDQIVSGAASGNSDFPGEIIIWDAKTGDKISELNGHTNAVACVAWRPGGDQIASGSRDYTIIIWDAKTGEQVSTLTGHTNTVTSVAWRPVGDQIASASIDKTIIIWDAKKGEQVSTLQGHTNRVTSVAWRPEGDQIASASYDETIIIWDAKTGDQLSTLKGHTNAVTSVAWRPGGDQIASGSADQTVIIWEAKTGDQVWILNGHFAPVTSVAWCPEGYKIVSGGYGFKTFSAPGEIIIWDATTGELVSILRGHTSAVTSVAWRPGGDQIASAFCFDHCNAKGSAD